MNLIQSRVPREEYDAIPGVNVTRLKELRRSPLHYQAAATHPKSTDALTLGIATHTAVLEPERFGHDFAVWNKRLANGRAAPRNGGAWDAFKELHCERTILTGDEADLAMAIAKAVRFDETANKYLAVGDPEVTMQWEIEGRPCRGRVDWLTQVEGEQYLVGLKTTRDCRHFAFGSQAAKLDYAIQWAWYCDGYEAITGKVPHMIEIVVENTAPFAVATYRIENDILLQGRDNYRELLKILRDCEAAGEWPGPVQGEQILTLPSWYYPSNEAEDLADLGLEPIT